MDDAARRIWDVWFGPLDADGHAAPERARRWFGGGPAFDAEIREGFLADVRAARAGEREAWTATPEGAVAYVLLLDQVTRNVFRGTPEMFAGDARALAAARGALDRGLDRALPADPRRFLYMPFMHSEALADQDRSVALFRAQRDAAPAGRREGDDAALDFALRHRAIVQRFGRFPHRNAILGRTSTAEEIAFLGEPGSSF
jgi:uncharacterized protein (DUF924 family)